MSFGLLKHFKDIKKDKDEEKPKLFYRHIIIGQDLGSILKLCELKRSHPEDSIKLISARPVNRQMLYENYQFGISALRSENAVTEIYKKHFNAKILPQSNEALFYKDGKFHEFSGRAKPMELLSGEEFFTKKGYTLEISSLFNPEDWENLDKILIEHQEIRIFESIEKTNPEDLVEKNEWLLSFKDFQKIYCENLYVGISPKKFHSHLINKDLLTPEIIDFTSSIEAQAALSVTWALKKEVHPEDRTLFIPQSMTHEWGHFIVEFESYNHAQKEQLCHALFLIHDEEPQSEDLASKIKLMKRVIDRVFPELEKNINKEYIRFDEDMYLSNVKDKLLEQIGFDYPTLKFIGQVAHMPENLQTEKFLARTALS
jgi:hypothetical protein